MTDRTDRLCRLTILDLHEPVPAMLERRGHRTLIRVDLWADRYDLLRFLHTQLHPGEFNTIREAFGWPERMVPTAWLEEAGPIAVPESLRLPAPALTGDDDR